VVFGAVLGAIPGTLAGVDALATAGVIVGALVVGYALLLPGQVYQCPYCRKRVKAGRASATTAGGRLPRGPGAEPMPSVVVGSVRRCSSNTPACTG
jgi:hypothetical protein